MKAEIAVWDWERERVPDARVVVCRPGLFDGEDVERKKKQHTVCFPIPLGERAVVASMRRPEGGWMPGIIPALYAERPPDLEGSVCECRARRYPEVQDFKRQARACPACHGYGRVGGIASLLAVKADRRALVLCPREAIEIGAWLHLPPCPQHPGERRTWGHMPCDCRPYIEKHAAAGRMGKIDLVVIIPPPEARRCAECGGARRHQCHDGEDGTEWASCEACAGRGVIGQPWPMHPAWVRGIVEQCRAASVPVCFLGWGAWIPAEYNGSSAYKLPDGSLSHCLSKHWVEVDGDMVIAKLVGSTQSGRLLDGAEVMEIPEWLS